MVETQGILQDVYDPAARALRVVFHDALYAYAHDMGGGALLAENAQDVGWPRRTLAMDAVDRVKGVWAIPVGWNTVAFRFGWSPAVATAGNVKFALEYTLFFPFAANDVDLAPVTTISIPAINSPGIANRFVYQIPTETDDIVIGEGAFGSKPFMMWSLERDGITDTLAGGVDIEVATLSRIN
jgi:hypothetical protein